MATGLVYDGVIFVDIETSGLEADKHEIIQIAAIHAPTQDEFEYKVQFDKDKATIDALAINGFTKKAWEGAITADEMVKRFADFCNSHRSLEKISRRGTPWYQAVLGGYNIGFDKDFIIKAYKERDMFVPFDYRAYDVYELAKWMLPGRDSYKLVDVAKYLGVYEEGEHDALIDIRMTMNVAAILLKRLEVVGISIPNWAKRVEDKKDGRETNAVHGDNKQRP